MARPHIHPTRAILASLLVALLSVVALAQTSPRAAMLEASAWDALEASRFEAAAVAFREAIVGDPGNARLHLGAGAAAFALRRDADARAALERALEINPALPQASELLGRVLYRTGNLDDAIRVYEALLAETPARTGIAEPLERWRREAELRNRMDLAVGHGVTVAFDGPEDAALAAEAVASIERASVRIWDVLSFYPTKPIAVVLYTNQQFRDITRSPSWAAGAFDGTIRIPMRGALANQAELDRVLAHEYTHALVHELAAGGVPAWLDEGLAAALERGSPRETPPVEARVPLRTLEKSFGRLSDRDVERAYAFSAFAVRRLLDDAGGFALTNLLRDLGDGVPFDAAFEHRMQRAFTSFEASLTTP
jgi:tetratricopeptide (TPR) repeat protein